MSSPLSVLEACLRTRYGGWSKQMFAKLLPNEFGADMVIGHYRQAPYDSCFFVDRDNDRESISKHKCDGMWWIFAANLQTKIAVISNLNMDFTLWYTKRNFYFDLLMATNKLHKDCIDIICDLIDGSMQKAPAQCPLTVSKINQPQYHYIMISDQKGGLVTCGLCMHSKQNVIISLRDYTDELWIEHEKSCLHQSMLQ